MNLEEITKRLAKVTDLVKSSFADETTDENTEVVAKKFEEVTLIDGETVLSYDGELADGTAMFIVIDGEQVSAPEGTYELGGEMAGVSIVVDADGLVLEVVDARENGDVSEGAEPETMSSEDVNAIVDAKMSAISEPLNAIVNGIESILKENDSLKNEIESLKKDIVEFKATPSIEKEEKTKFSRSEKMSRREEYLQNLRK